jgi:hypothetical protein
MKNDCEHISMEFHNRATLILFSVDKEFKYSVASIDRQGDENVFQHLHNKFAGKLKYQLQSVARELLHTLRTTTDCNLANQTLSRFIEEYVHEFMQRVRAL